MMTIEFKNGKKDKLKDEAIELLNELDENAIIDERYVNEIRCQLNIKLFESRQLGYFTGKVRDQFDEDIALVIINDEGYVVLSSKGNFANAGSKNINIGGTISGIFSKYIEDKPEKYEGSEIEKLIEASFDVVIKEIE